MEVRVLQEVIGIAGGCECLGFSPVHPQITCRLGGFRRQWFYHTCGSWGNEEVSQHWFSLVSAAGAELGTERIACGASGPFPLDALQDCSSHHGCLRTCTQQLKSAPSKHGVAAACSFVT